MYRIARAILFKINPEKIHDFIVCFFSKTRFSYPLFRLLYNTRSEKEIQISNLTFKNELGVAAGFDKNAELILFCEALGFSHVEVGTVTPLPQSGNPKPRLFRLVKDNAILNRMGFNNIGAEAINKNILSAKKRLINKKFIIGVNIGKNKDTPLKNAKDDYIGSMEILYSSADYFTINISSPNTEGLRKLQSENYLEDLLKTISEKNIQFSENNLPKQIYLKIAPDLTNEEVKFLFDSAVKYNFTGIIATNTTINKNNLNISENEIIKKYGAKGGISGKPLKKRSDEVLNILSGLNKNGQMIIIASGGVFNKKDFTDKINMGAKLVQIYTGFIYEGPGIVKRILK